MGRIEGSRGKKKKGCEQCVMATNGFCLGWEAVFNYLLQRL